MSKFKRHERDMAKLVGGRRSPASGAVWWMKADGETDEIKFECKCTDRASISITASMLRKIVLQALPHGKVPVIFVRLKVSDALVPTDWALLPAEDLAFWLNKEADR